MADETSQEIFRSQEIGLKPFKKTFAFSRKLESRIFVFFRRDCDPGHLHIIL